MHPLSKLSKKPQARRVKHARNAKAHTTLLSRFKGVDWAALRFRTISVLFVVAFSVIWMRTAYLQLWEGSILAASAKRQHLASEVITSPRGMITDRNGYILARSVKISSVSADPRRITELAKTVDELAAVLDISRAKLTKQLSRDRAFVWIQRKITDAQAAELRKAKLPGIMLNREFERVYPYKQVAGQLLGFVGIDGNGLEGLELAYDKTLSGLSTREMVQRDASGRRFYIANGTAKRIPQDLRLSLDMQIQFIAEEVIAKAVDKVEAKWGGVLIADVRSGEILAWAQYPFFNPNSFRQASPSLYRNRLALDSLEHGSTLKPLVVAAALQENVITKDTVFDCEAGIWETEYITIRDDGRAYNDLSVSKILSLSSNIGLAKIGLELGVTRFHRSLSNLGFGQRTNLQLAESKGILHHPRDWSEVDVMSAAFGQSVAATTVQMAQAFLTLANEGLFRPIRLEITEVNNDGGGQRIFTKTITQDVLNMMREVVDNGTGRRAAIPGVAISGKTGTAQKADNTGKYGAERMGSFVGIFPTDDPQFLVITILDEPQTNQYGGVIAAPVFKEVATRLLAYMGEVPELAQNSAAKPARTKRVVVTKGLPLVNGEYRNALQTTRRPQQAIIHAAVPDVTGKSVRNAVEMFAQQGLVPTVKGSGNLVVKQIPPAGHAWSKKEKEAGECVLWLSNATLDESLTSEYDESLTNEYDESLTSEYNKTAR